MPLFPDQLGPIPTRFRRPDRRRPSRRASSALDAIRPPPPAPYLPLRPRGVDINGSLLAGLDSVRADTSTKFPSLGLWGVKQDRQTVNELIFVSVSYHRYRCKMYSCQRQPRPVALAA